jgi:hypothetical protein
MSKKNEQQIRHMLKILSQIEPSSEGLEQAKQRVRNNLINTQDNPVSVTARIIQALLNGKALKFAAAAIILIVIGFIAGRIYVPAVDMEELQAALEPAIRQQLQEQWQRTYANNLTQIKNELTEQFSRDLTEFAEQTLAASSTMTDQRLNELVQLIEAARTQDRRWIAAALEQIELNRRQDNARIGNGLVTLATRTNDLQRIEEN